MLGIIYSIAAGICMSLQGVFNTRLGDKIGQWETNLFVQGTGLAVTLFVLFFTGKGNLKNLKDSNIIYMLGGVLGVIIIFTVMKGIKILGTTHTISIILIAQLASAAAIDLFGFFDTTKVPFHISKIIGICVMIVGIVIFKWKG